MASHIKRTVLSLIFIMLLFVCIFALSYYNFRVGTRIFDLGMPGGLENIVVMLFSVIGIIKVIADIIGVETRARHIA